MKNYYEIAFTEPVLELQGRKGSRASYERVRERREGMPLGVDEMQMITTRDSLYLASVGETGWPYVQHRGGTVGFVKVLGESTIGWLERLGNRQYVSTGNMTADGRVALFLVDYPTRTRLKLFGHATYHPEPPSALLEAYQGKAPVQDGAVTIEIVSFDWNCPKYITPRFTAEAVRAMTAPLRERIAELELRLAEQSSEKATVSAAEPLATGAP